MSRPAGAAPPVVELLGPDTEPSPHLGGKGRALAQLVTGGFPVPATGVVTTAAYWSMAHDAAVAELVSAVVTRSDAGGPTAHEVDEIFARANIAAEIERAIVELASTVGGGGAIAVRSSATVEDLHGSSFAGQYRSLLDVDSSDPDQVMDAVSQVWASLWHPAPTAYRRAFAIDQADIAMAVVVMAMVPAESAGVVFTADPGGTSGARVEAVEGLGESLVSGQRTPSAWVVPLPGDATPAAGPDLPAVPARALELAVGVEQFFGTPQDVEWAATTDDVFVVQARPITVLDEADGFDTPVDDHELTTAGIVEMVPGVLPPLRWELNGFLLEEAFRSVLDSVGVIEGDHHEEQPFVRRVRGRAAIDFDQLRAVAAEIPGAAEELERQYFNEESVESDRPPDQGRTTIGQRLRMVNRELATLRTSRQVIDQADVVILATTGLRDQRPELSARPRGELLAYLQRLVDLAARGLAAELGVAAAAAASYRQLELQLSRHLGPGDGPAAARAVIAHSGAAASRVTSSSAAIFAGSTWTERGTRPPEPRGPDDAAQRRDRDALEARLRAVPGWTRRRILTGQIVDTRIHLLRRTIAEVIQQLRRREATKAAVLEIGGEARRVILEIGTRLVDDGALDEPVQAELMTTGELSAALLDGEPTTMDVIRRRRNWRSRYGSEGSLPIRFTGVPSREPTSLPEGDHMEGWAASPGRARGRARVVTDPGDSFGRGEVLVAEATDASWSPLFVRAAAVVVERGGPLSHAAILARELGLPAVLNLAGATGVLDGRTVSVDGDQGVVVIEATSDSPSPETNPLEAAVPWADRRPGPDPLGDVDIDRTMVFVPAIMSVGLVFSVISLLRDMSSWTGSRARRRRTRMEAGAVLSELLGGERAEPDDLGMLARPAYLLSALALTGAAAYVAIGSLANFLRDHSAVRDIGWLLAISLVLAITLGFLGGVSLTVFRSWPQPPPWTLGPLRTAPLTTTPGLDGAGPRWALSMTAGITALFTGLIALMVGSGRSVTFEIDRPIMTWIVEAAWIDHLRFVKPFGGTAVSIAFVALIGLAGFRCRVMAVAFPGAFLASVVTAGIIREIVERPRPVVPGDVESFPSGHLLQAVFIAGLVPLAIEILFSARRLAVVLRIVLGLGVVAAALQRVHAQFHYPLDVIAGMSLGLTVVLGTHWVVAHRSWHQRCSSCPWSPAPGPAAWQRGVLPLGPSAQHRLAVIGAVGAMLSASGLAALVVLVGLPSDPEGYGFTSQVSDSAQVGLAALLALAGAVAFRWQAAGAVLMALAAGGLGLLASIQYQPILAVALTAALLVPAVLVWLSWQPTETVGSISALAAVTGGMLLVTTMGAQSIYGFYFGPSHPESAADGLDLGEGDWAWLGGVGTDEATIVVGGLDDEPVVLWYEPVGAADEAPSMIDAEVDQFGLARFELTGLHPDTGYRYGVDERPEPGQMIDTESATAIFQTFDDGPQDLVVALGSCARVGSNVAVFDVIAERDPDLFLAIGDLHYANLDSTDPADHVAQFGRTASQPGQAAIYSSVPTAYVWDDHDYGPDNSDSSSPSRQAAGQAYRAAIPHSGVDPDPERPIAQAFTVGRVRFVLTDGRSQRDDHTLLGTEQFEWLLDELVTASADHALVVWANPTPWIGEPSPDSDSWLAYPDERAAISVALAEAGVDNLVMVSGDAHMVAIDDGTNTAYHDGPEPGFPVLHAAALDRPGSVKGGPYSHGAYPGAGQFGLLEISDDGGPVVEVRLSGHTWDRKELVSYRFQIDG